jgi:hypothetical protein
MERVGLDAPSKDAPHYLPLLSPEFCDERYRRFVEKHMGSHRAMFNIPDCRKPPYKRTSFKNELVDPK